MMNTGGACLLAEQSSPWFHSLPRGSVSCPPYVAAHPLNVFFSPPIRFAWLLLARASFTLCDSPHDVMGRGPITPPLCTASSFCFDVHLITALAMYEVALPATHLAPIALGVREQPTTAASTFTFHFVVG